MKGNRCACNHRHHEHKWCGKECMVPGCVCPGYVSVRRSLWKYNPGVDRLAHPDGVIRSAAELQRLEKRLRS